MSDIVLFNPAAWKSVGDVVLPISLLAVSSCLDPAWDVTIIDQQTDPDWKRTLRSAIRKRPICVGITCITGRQVQFALSASRLVKENSDLKVVWGGIQATQAPQVTLSHPLVDIIVRGEGYTTFPELVVALKEGKPLEDVRGIWFKKGDRLVKNPERPFVELDQIPDLPYHLIDVEDYIRRDGQRRSLDIITSSGCPYACAFCYNNAFHKSRWRAMSADKVLKNIRTLVETYGINQVRILDDQFFVNKERDKLIVEGIREMVWNGHPDFSWEVMGAHVNSVVRWNEDFLRAADESNCTVITAGIETASERLQRMINKGLSAAKVLRANRVLKKTRIRPLYSFMSGFPTETDDDLRAMIDLMERLKAENPNIDCGLIHPYVPYPGTKLYDKAVSDGFKAPETLEDWAEYSWDKYTRLNIPWIGRKRQRMLLDLYYCSALMNADYTYITSKVYEHVARALSRLARYRMRHLDFRFPIEIRLLELGKKIFVESH